MISSNNGDPMKSSPETRKIRSGSSIFMTLELNPIPVVQSDASFSDSLRRQRVIRRSLDGDDGGNGSRNNVNGLRPHEQPRRHSANLPQVPQSSLVKAVSTPDLASKSIFTTVAMLDNTSSPPRIMRRRTLDYSWKPEFQSTTDINLKDNSDDHTTGENGHKALDPTALRYLPKILRDTYAQRQTKRPSIVR